MVGKLKVKSAKIPAHASVEGVNISCGTVSTFLTSNQHETKGKKHLPSVHIFVVLIRRVCLTRDKEIILFENRRTHQLFAMLAAILKMSAGLVYGGLSTFAKVCPSLP